MGGILKLGQGLGRGWRLVWQRKQAPGFPSAHCLGSLPLSVTDGVLLRNGLPVLLLGCASFSCVPCPAGSGHHNSFVHSAADKHGDCFQLQAFVHGVVLYCCVSQHPPQAPAWGTPQADTASAVHTHQVVSPGCHPVASRPHLPLVQCVSGILCQVRGGLRHFPS